MNQFFYVSGIVWNSVLALSIAICVVSFIRYQLHNINSDGRKYFTSLYNDLKNKILGATSYYTLKDYRGEIEALRFDYGGFEQPKVYKLKINNLYKLYYKRLRIVAPKTKLTAQQ